jgi:ribosomal-protein-alanine N-acetyltransferase
MSLGVVSPMDVISTKRLILRTWNHDDLEEAITPWGDPAVMALIDGRGGLNRQQVAEKLAQEIANQERYAFQYWKVRTRDDEEFVGCCGLRPGTSGEPDVIEMGFHLVKTQWGKGYATEAAQGVIRYAFEVLRLPKVFAGHHPKNLASKAVLDKLGFRLVGERFYPPTGEDHPFYELEAT